MQILILIIGVLQVLAAVYFYHRVLGENVRFLHFLLALGTLLLAFRVVYWMQPSWYFLSSTADAVISPVCTAAETATTVLLLWRLTRKPFLQVVLFFSLRVLIMVASSLLPFALFALFTGEPVAQLIAIEWNDVLFAFVTAVLEIGLLFAAAETICRYVGRQTVELRWSRFVPVIGAQVLSLGCIAALRQDADSFPRMLAVLLMLTVVYAIADVVLLHAFRALVRNSELERDVGLLLQQQQLQKAYYLSLHEQLKSAQRMRHDYRNVLQTIDTLLASGEGEKARGFAREAGSALSSGGLTAYTGSEVLDAVLNNKAEMCRRDGIAFSMQLALPSPLGVSDVDLMSVFSNLLDNAIEYVRTLPTDAARRIDVSSDLCAGLWVLRFANTFAGETLPSFETSKQDKKLHGQGGGIVRAIAEKYDGAVMADVRDGVLTMTITLNTACGQHAD